MIGAAFLTIFHPLFLFPPLPPPPFPQSNHVYGVLQTYGVEAARQALVNEVKGVFDVYHIGVDQRHLSLVADYMTFEGG